MIAIEPILIYYRVRWENRDSNLYTNLNKVYTLASCIWTVTWNPGRIFVAWNDAVWTSSRVKAVLCQARILSSTPLLSVANSVETGLVVLQHPCGLINSIRINIREAHLNRVKFFVNGIALGWLAVSAIWTIVMNYLDWGATLVEVNVCIVWKKYWVGVQGRIRNVAPNSRVELVKNGVSWGASHIELDRTVGQWFLSAISVLEKRRSRVVVRIVELNVCHVDVSSETKVLKTGCQLIFSRLRAGSVLA